MLQVWHWLVTTLNTFHKWCSHRFAFPAFFWLEVDQAGWQPVGIRAFEVVSAPDAGVVACNMAHTPLKDGTVDAAVFCLALMGRDYGSFLEVNQAGVFVGAWCAVRGSHAAFNLSQCVLIMTIALCVSQEAYRLLRPGAWLWIAEVRSRFADGAGSSQDQKEAAEFLGCLKRLGMQLKQQDASNKMFIVWELQKVPVPKGASSKAKSIDWPELKPCVYKKR